MKLSSASLSIRVGTSAVLVAGACSIAAGVGVSPASAAAAKSCSGQYEATVRAPKGGEFAKWDSTVTHLDERGTTCGNAKAAASAFARATCGECTEVTTLAGYAVSQRYKPSGFTLVTMTKASTFIQFHFGTYPRG